jgi:methyltransferase-like protein
VIRNLEECNLIAREQYLDFIEGRSFRQTLLCHQHQHLDRALKPERLNGLFIAAESKPARAEADLTGPAQEDFQRGKAVIATSHPVLKCALAILGEVWPRSLAFVELLARARARAGRVQNDAAEIPQADAQDLGEFLLRCYTINFVELHACPSPFLTELSYRPLASPLARLQSRNGPVVVSLRHLTLRIEDRLGVRLLGLLDGSRDRAALVDELTRLILSGDTPLLRDGQPLTEPAQVRNSVSADLDNNLRALAKLGLLVG